MSLLDAYRSLGVLVDGALLDMASSPFDPVEGVGLGRALATAGMTGPAVPIASARVMLALAEYAGGLRPSLVAAYIAEIGRGHRTYAASAPDAGGGVRAVPRHRDAGEYAVAAQAVFDHSVAAMAVLDIRGAVLHANPAFAAMIGVPVEQVNELSLFDFAHPDDHDHIRTLLYERLIPAGAGTISLKQRLVRGDGTIGWMNIGITMSREPTRIRISSSRSALMLAEQFHHQLRPHHQARHDPLTGLPNRRYPNEAIDRASDTAAEGNWPDCVSSTWTNSRTSTTATATSSATRSGPRSRDACARSATIPNRSWSPASVMTNLSR